MQINGFINLYKPTQITSNKALGILKKTLKENNIVTKVGHLGTLDPIAEGVLPVALGRATRLFDYTIDKIKRYTATFKFGINTDTLDIDGAVTDTSNFIPTLNDIQNVIPSLIGKIDQIPPAYSSKVVNGVRAYKLARKGIDVELKPKQITIYDIKLIEQTGPDTFKFDISCSGGTYVRSIARDMGKSLDTYSIMSALVRTQSGCFTIENSLNNEFLKENLKKYIIPMEEAIKDIPIFLVPEEYKKPLYNGVPLLLDNIPEGNLRIYHNDLLIGIGAKNQDNKLKIKTWLL